MSTESRSEDSSVGAVAWVVLVAAFGGFLFGFDTAVINGAVGPIRVSTTAENWTLIDA